MERRYECPVLQCSFFDGDTGSITYVNDHYECSALTKLLRNYPRRNDRCVFLDMLNSMSDMIKELEKIKSEHQPMM